MSRHGLPVRNRHAIPSRINRWSPNLLPRLPTSDGITDSTAAQNSSEITPIRVTGQSSLVNAFKFGRHALVPRGLLLRHPDPSFCRWRRTQVDITDISTTVGDHRVQRQFGVLTLRFG